MTLLYHASIMCNCMTLSLLRNIQVRDKEKEKATLFNAKRKLPCFVPMLIMYLDVPITKVYIEEHDNKQCDGVCVTFLV